jgi:hypothetical protein
MRKLLVLMPLCWALACVPATDPNDDVVVIDEEMGDMGQQGDMPAASVVVTPRLEPAGAGFYRTPWPSDARLKDGKVDLSDFPRASTGLIRLFREVLETIDGFATMPVVYVQLDAMVPAEALPTSKETLTASGGVQLVELGAGCGARVPLHVDVDAGHPEDPFIEANTLRAAPLPGFVLKPATSYALIMRADLGGKGARMVRPAGFEGMLEASAGAGVDAGWYASLAPLRACLGKVGVSADEIALATVFTTQDPVSETLKMRDVALKAAKPPQIADWKQAKDTPNGVVYTFTYEAPIFQRGASPYNTGGGVELDAQGMPKIQRYELVPASIILPKVPKRTPMPVLVWSDGTGASQLGHVSDNVIQAIVAQGFAVANFVPQFHDTRKQTAGTSEETSTFNYLNPESGRTVFRQQAVETVYFTRVIREALTGVEVIPDMDLERMVYGGHSQGAIVGAIVAGITDEFRAYSLNGIGAYLASVIVYRKDYLDIELTIRKLLRVGRELDMYHPTLQLAQLGAEAVDPHNYARRWKGDAEHQGAHFFLCNGGEDDTTSRIGMSAITIAADLAPIKPAGWSVDPQGVWERSEEALPISGNRTDAQGSPRTMVSYLVAGSNHFTIYRNTRAANMFASFWLNGYSGVPTVQ